MILKPVRVFTGEVLVEVRGRGAERFFNLCSGRGMFLRKVCRREEGCQCVMTSQEFLQCRPLARKSGVRLHIAEKRGIPFLLFRQRRRWGYVLGIFLALGILGFCSRILWNVELEGGSRHTLDQFVSFLGENGVRSGVFMDDIVCGDLEEALRNAYPDILWVSAQKSGCILKIQIRENAQWQETEAESEEADAGATDLVAESDGVIESIVTRQGTPLVKAGDEVTAGQVLVSGILTLTDDAGEVSGYKLVNADADVTAITTEEYHWERETAEETTSFGGLMSLAVSVRVRGKRITAGIGREGAQVTEGSWYSPKLFGTFALPVSVQINIGRNLVYTRRNLTEEEMNTLCQEALEEYTETLREKGVQILEKDVKVEAGSFRLRMDGTLTLQGPMGETAPSEELPEEKETE